MSYETGFFPQPSPLHINTWPPYHSRIIFRLPLASLGSDGVAKFFAGDFDRRRDSRVRCRPVRVLVLAAKGIQLLGAIPSVRQSAQEFPPENQPGPRVS